MKYFLLIILFFFKAQAGHTQDSVETKKEWELNGYIKDLQSLSFDKNSDNLISGNLIHNRINFKWKPSTKYIAAVEIRNRLFWGDEVKLIPDFAKNLRSENEWMNLSVVWLNKSGLILHSNIERLWMEVRETKWKVRAGRQRINWGVATIWNPNDIFNTYNFLDFDYEERPGSDAVKFQYMISDFSNIELAAASSVGDKKTIIAAKYATNQWGYDFQFTGGVYRSRFTLGTGWAGSIGDAGFKGEAQYFSKADDSVSVFNTTMEIDYVFKNGWYFSSSFLYNSRGLSKPLENWSKISFEFSPTNLMPAQWSFIVMASKEFTPLLTGSLSLVYSPGMNLFIFLPSLKYNLAPNLDIDMIFQSFFLEMQNRVQGAAYKGFLRLKWNF